MLDKVFIDTNLFVYVVDGRDELKAQIVRNLVNTACFDNALNISYQVVQEFFNATLKTKNAHLNRKLIADFVRETLIPVCTVQSSIALTVKAFELQERYQYSYYDCLIIAAALEVGCSKLYSEDFQHGHVIGELAIINPFERPL